MGELIDSHIMSGRNHANRRQLQSEIRANTVEVDALLKQYELSRTTEIEHRLLARMLATRTPYLKAVREILEEDAVDEPLRRVVAVRVGQEVPRILIVDDLRDNRDWMIKLLGSIGFDVREAENGKAAIACWEEWRPHAILMDLQMPVLDGLEAIRRIRTGPDGNKPSIIALTASALEHEQKVAMAAGADAFVAKPCHEEELLERIRVLLGIDYEYDTSPDGDEIVEVPFTVLRPERLRRVPQDLRARMGAAVSNGNKSELDELIFRERESGAAESAKALQQLADGYEYDALTRLLEEASRQ